MTEKKVVRLRHGKRVLQRRAAPVVGVLAVAGFAVMRSIHCYQVALAKPHTRRPTTMGKRGYHQTFAIIRDETYQINDLEWIVRSDEHAVCRYRFTWSKPSTARREQEAAVARTSLSTMPEPGRCFTNTSVHNRTLI